MTTKEPESAQDKLSRLLETANALMSEVETVAHEGGKQFVAQAHASKVNRRLSVVAITGLVLDVILSVVLGIGLSQVHKNEQSIGALTDRLNVSQTVTRQKALCPLYGVFLDSESPQGRAAAPDPEKYDQAFKVIREGYKILNCSEFLDSPDPKPPGQP